MKISRNQECPCGSSLKYKNCCGNLVSIQEIEATSKPGGRFSEIVNTSLHEISNLIEIGKINNAQYLLQKINGVDKSNPYILNFWGLIASQLGLTRNAKNYFNLASAQNPQWLAPKLNLKKVATLSNEKYKTNNEKFILIKAWGAGFWSDISHVLSQLLVAEITGRTPITHWGGNSLYSIDPSKDAFNFYFESISNKTCDDIQSKIFSYWPPKWNSNNLLENNLNKANGPFSKVSSLYFLGREEDVVVSDFWSSVFSVLPWIPEDNPLHNLSIDEIFLYLAKKYLKPKVAIQKKIDDYLAEVIDGKNFIAVHIRGSDKVIETLNLEYLNSLYKPIIDRELSKNNIEYIFLMTDDERILGEYKKYYGDKLLYTNSTRTSSSTGIHHILENDKYKIGEEIVVDTYIAAQANVFIGNATSNPSLMVSCLKKWQADYIHLLGNNHFHNPKDFLFETRLD